MKHRKTQKRDMWTPVLCFVFLAGISLLLYPTFSNYRNTLRQSRVIAQYAEEVAQLDHDRYDDLWDAAHAYNATLPMRADPYTLTQRQAKEYDSLLNLSGSGIMGYIEIPSIDCSLAVSHGTGDEVLQTSVGHVTWSSLPAGGADTHCVLSAHRGLPSAKLFTDLDQVQTGDIFFLRILDEILTYEVDQILVVEPHEVSSLRILEGEDLCTLVTCTPYGINTHRLLVRGHRVDTAEYLSPVRITADAIQIDPTLLAPLAAVPLVCVLAAGLFLFRRKNS